MRLLTVGILSLFVLVQISAQGIEFFEGDFEAAMVKAQEEEKLIFVDAYTTWCGPCKRMSAKVFPEPAVGDFFNANFVNMKIDMEKEMGRAFKQKFPVSAYPTLFFINGKGELVHKSVGGKDAKSLVQVGELAVRKYDRSVEYAELYEKGDRSHTLMVKYVSALNKAGKSSTKIANEYVRSNPDITDDERALFLFAAATYADSRLFDLMSKEKKRIIKLKSDKEYEQKVLDACRNTAMKAVEYESADLLKEAQDKCKSCYKKGAKAFSIESDMLYAKGMGDEESYLESAEKYAKKVINKDSQALLKLASEICVELKKNTDGLALSEDIAKKSLKIENSTDAYIVLARIMKQGNKDAEAIKYATKALEKNKMDGKSTQEIEKFLKYLNS